MNIRITVRIIALMLVTLITAACGGGAGTNTGSQSPTAVTTGVITAINGKTGGKEASPTGAAITITIRVNGIDYAIDSGQLLLDDDDQLEIGMVVTIKSHHDDPLGMWRAVEINCDHFLKGPVSSVDPVAGTLVVLGQTVAADSATILDHFQTFSDLKQGDMVVVSGYLDANGEVRATRIDLKPFPFIPDYTPVKLIGQVDAVGGHFEHEDDEDDEDDDKHEGFHTHTLAVGPLVVTSARPLSDDISEGSLVKVIGTLSTVDGPLAAMSVRLKGHGLQESVKVEIEGFVTNLSPADGTFTIGGLLVDAHGLSLSGIEENDLVEVEGRLVNGVLVASEIEMERRHYEYSHIASHLPALPAGQMVFALNCATCHNLTGASVMNLAGKGGLVVTKFPTPGTAGHKGITLSSRQTDELQGFLR